MTPTERARDWFTQAPEYRTTKTLAKLIGDAEKAAFVKAAKKARKEVSVDWPNDALSTQAKSIEASILELKN